MTTSENPADRTVQVLTAGQLFVDIVYSRLPRPPQPGEEIWTPDFGWSPGGIANLALAASRLGAHTAVCAAVGTDALSSLCIDQLSHDHIDLSGLRACQDWSLPVTASLGYDGDRALVTGGVPSPTTTAELLAEAPHAEVAALDLDPSTSEWARTASTHGTRVFADLGWDNTESWDPATLDGLDGCHAFLPNEVEALSYTRTESAREAARRLAQRVPLVVVTLGARGCLAVDSSTGEEELVPPVPIRAVDPTGAGDVFGGALMVATLTPWSLRERLDFASLVSAISVSRPGGASATARVDELVTWLDEHPETDHGRFGFLRNSLAHAEGLPFTPFPPESAHPEPHHQETHS